VIRVLQLVTRDEAGGVQVLTRSVEAGLRVRGIEVTTLALSIGGSMRARLGHLWTIVRLLVFGRYDAVLSYHAAAGAMAALFGWIGRIPTRAVHQTAMPHAVRPHWRLLDRWCGVLGLHTQIIANSRATELAFAGYPAGYRSRLRIIAHGVPPLPHAGNRFDWRIALFIPPAAALLVTTGRLMPQKNHAVAVAALVELPYAHLIIAGEGSERAALMAQAKTLGVATRLHLIGDRPRATIASLLSAADIYIFPSVWETFGLAVVEAGMSGVPVVAANLPVLREVLQPACARGMAQFHAPDDATALASQIRAMLEDYPSAALRHACAEAMAEQHGIAPMLDAYECLLAGASRLSR